MVRKLELTKEEKQRRLDQYIRSRIDEAIENRIEVSHDASNRAMTREVEDATREAVRDGVDPERAENSLREQLARVEQELADHKEAKRRAAVPGAEGGSKESYSFGRVARAVMLGRPQDAPYELEVTREVIKNDPSAVYALARSQGVPPHQIWAMGSSVDEMGGFLVPNSVQESRFSPLLRPRVVAQRLGIQEDVFDYPTSIPVEKTAPTATATPENQPATETSVKFGQLSVQPHPISSFVPVSNQLLSMSATAENRITSIMAREIGLEMNRQILAGAGGDEMLGLLSQIPAANVVDFDDGTLDATPTAFGAPWDLYVLLRKMVQKVSEAEALEGAISPGWAVAHRFAEAAALVKSENNAAGTASGEVQRAVVGDGDDSRMIGHRYARTGQLTSGAVTQGIFGDWDQALLCNFGPMVMAASNQNGTAFQSRQTHFLAYCDKDLAVLQPSAFSTCTDFDTSALA